ncbi:MAG: SIMPL domain-containing protein [Sulfurimonas sp.]|jgi:hypothetical protein|uniref:SIMPL domain-containing protein n=1 Tax=Sulfurimonas sp. TaxID=2022749 RepID=UPI00262B98CD|nr:SIMPL domain-containing protein [Sulfurimonas sp.]MDD3475508.1 SIMPL domain-containing protein [Sulfurimonas sp.]
MNLLKLSLISLLVTFSYGYELKINKTFDESLEPDRMQLSFSLIAKKESAAKAKEVLHKAIESIKKEPLCKGGGYSITPEYNYNSKERELLDYIGTADFECSFKNIEEIDTLLAFFDKLEDLELRQAPIRWVVDKENMKIEKTSLEFRAIKYAKEYTEILSIEEIAKCSVKNVEIIADGYTRYEAQNMLMSKSTMQTPTKEPTILNLNATYTYDCE